MGRNWYVCDYTDGFAHSFIGVKDNTYKVLVERSLLTEGLYRIVNPYNSESGYTDKVHRNHRLSGVHHY